MGLQMQLMHWKQVTTCNIKNISENIFSKSQSVDSPSSEFWKIRWWNDILLLTQNETTVVSRPLKYLWSDLLSVLFAAQWCNLPPCLGWCCFMQEHFPLANKLGENGMETKLSLLESTFRKVFEYLVNVFTLVYDHLT